MDGHHLTKRIKTAEQIKQLPVIIFSSLINDEMRRKGEALGRRRPDYQTRNWTTDRYS
jgi:two-component system chemotaxis response regulator CheV